MSEIILATELNSGVLFKYNGAPYRVNDSQKMSVGGYGGTNKLRAENLLNGKLIPICVRLTEKFESVDIELIKAVFIYSHKGEYFFHKAEDKKARFNLREEILKEKAKYLKQNLEVELIEYEDKIIDIKLPIIISYRVKSAPPSIKGSTAQGGSKQIVLENGLVINAPLFINQDDIITVNTQTGEYSERLEKA